MVVGEQAFETGLGGAERDAVLRPLGAGDARLDGRQVQCEDVVELGFRSVRVAPQALGAGIRLDQLAAVRRPAGEPQVADGLGVDGKEAARRAVLRRHVGDRRPVGQRQAVKPGTGELDELADHATAAQHGGDGEHEVGRRRALGQRAGQPHADDSGDEHRDRLAEHRRFRLDAADAPSEHGEAVDHRRMAVGADDGVGKGERASAGVIRRPHGPCEVFEVHLVADAGPRRHDAEVVERPLAPAQEGVALAVARHLDSHVLGERVRGAEAVHLHRVVDHQVDRHQRVDPRRILAEPGHRVAHRREIDHRRHAGEILHQNPRRPVGDLAVCPPRRQRLDVGGAHRGAVLVAQEVLEQDLEREGEPGDRADARLGRRGQAEIVVFAAARDERAANVQTVLAGAGHGRNPPVRLARRCLAGRRCQVEGGASSFAGPAGARASTANRASAGSTRPRASRCGS